MTFQPTLILCNPEKKYSELESPFGIYQGKFDICAHLEETEKMISWNRYNLETMSADAKIFVKLNSLEYGVFNLLFCFCFFTAPPLLQIAVRSTFEK